MFDLTWGYKTGLLAQPATTRGEFSISLAASQLAASQLAASKLASCDPGYKVPLC